MWPSPLSRPGLSQVTTYSVAFVLLNGWAQTQNLLFEVITCFFLYIKCFDKAIFFFLSFFPILSWCWHLRQSSIITLCSQQNLDTLAVIVMSTLHICSLDIVVEFELWNCFQLLFVTNKNLESKHHITSSITWLNTGSHLSQPTLSSVREDRAEWRNKLQEERN